MAFPNAHIYVRFNGSFGTSGATNAEKWSAGLRFGVIGADVNYNAAALQTFANSVDAATRTFNNTASIGVSSSCFFHNVSVARVGTDGKYSPAQQETTVSAGGPGAGAGIADQPWNSAGVISLRTGNFRGYASNGRLYWPMLTGNIAQATGRITSAAVNLRLTAAKTWFDAMNTAAGVYAVNMRICVMSATGETAAIVTSIRADDRLDSIERRENAGPTVWTTKTLA